MLSSIFITILILSIILKYRVRPDYYIEIQTKLISFSNLHVLNIFSFSLLFLEYQDSERPFISIVNLYKREIGKQKLINI